MDIWNRPTRIPEIYATLIALGLIAYFFLCYALGVIHVIELRLINLFIMLPGVYYALQQYKRTHGHHLNYFRGLVLGTATSALASATFTLFLFIYLKLDNSLMQSIITTEKLGPYLDPYIASFMVFIEGIFSGFFITFLLLNWIETDKVSDPIGRSE